MIKEEFFPTTVYGFDIPNAPQLNAQLEKANKIKQCNICYRVYCLVGPTQLLVLPAHGHLNE